LCLPENHRCSRCRRQFGIAALPELTAQCPHLACRAARRSAENRCQCTQQPFATDARRIARLVSGGDAASRHHRGCQKKPANIANAGLGPSASAPARSRCGIARSSAGPGRRMIADWLRPGPHGIASALALRAASRSCRCGPTISHAAIAPARRFAGTIGGWHLERANCARRRLAHPAALAGRRGHPSQRLLRIAMIGHDARIRMARP
jgi:hypothetical protein